MSRIDLWTLCYFHPPHVGGGGERFFRYAPGLAERGVDMTFVTPRRDRSPRFTVEPGRRLLLLGDPDDVLSPRGFVAAACREALRRSRPPDAFWFVTDVTRRQLPLVWALRARGVGSAFVRTMAWPLDSAAARQRLKLASFDRTVSSSQVVRRQLVERGAPPDRSVVVPNGVDTTRFSPATPDEVARLRRKLDLPVDVPVVLYVGLMVDRKGVADLVEGFRAYRRNGGRGVLVLVGDDRRYAGDEAFYCRWCRAMDGAETDGVVRRPNTGDIDPYFRSADLFAFLSRREGFGNVLLEAMACGVPVLTTRFDGLSIEHGRPGREIETTDRDEASVAAAFERLLGDESPRAELGRAGLAWIAEHHDVEKSLDTWATLARELSAEAKSWHRGLLRS